MVPGVLVDDTQAPVVSDVSSLARPISESQESAASISGQRLFSFGKHTILVTGGGRGLGITLARGVIEAGGHAACMDILPAPSEHEWSDLKVKAKQAGLTLTYHCCDIAREEDMRAVIDGISERGRALGAPLTGAIACAGIQQKIPVLEYPVADFERMLRVNTVGAFVTAKVVAADGRARRPW